MKKINILFLLQFIASLSLNAQDLDNLIDTDKNEKFIGVIQVSYIKNYEAINSISIYGRGAKDIGLNTDNAKAYSLNVILGYYVIPKRLSIGIGFGLDGYHEPGFNSAPLYGDVHFYLTNERNASYIYANFGGLAKLSNNFVRGYTGKIGF